MINRVRAETRHRNGFGVGRPEVWGATLRLLVQQETDMYSLGRTLALVS